MDTTFLTPQKRQAYDTVPNEITHREAIQFFTLTPDDNAVSPAEVSNLIISLTASY